MRQSIVIHALNICEIRVLGGSFVTMIYIAIPHFCGVDLLNLVAFLKVLFIQVGTLRVSQGYVTKVIQNILKRKENNNLCCGFKESFPRHHIISALND